jgi:hypothetical protein
MDVFSPIVMSKSASSGFGNTTSNTTTNGIKKPSPIQTQPLQQEMMQRSASSSTHGPSPLSSVPPLSAINLDALSASQIDSVPSSATIAPTKTNKILRNIDEAVASVKETIVSGVMGASFSSASIGGMVSAATNSVESILLKETSQKPSRVSLLEKSDSKESLQLIFNVFEDSLAVFRDQVRRDIRDMHVEVLRQFWIQKVRFKKISFFFDMFDIFIRY